LLGRGPRPSVNHRAEKLPSVLAVTRSEVLESVISNAYRERILKNSPILSKRNVRSTGEHQIARTGFYKNSGKDAYPEQINSWSTSSSYGFIEGKVISSIPKKRNHVF
jgi:hypothetical protein